MRRRDPWALARHRRHQAEERLAAGPKWEDHDLIIATHAGRPVVPHSLDRALEVVIKEAGLPRPTWRTYSSVWLTMLITLPSGARTKNLRTPHASSVSG
jgi:hypothetical protein